MRELEYVCVHTMYGNYCNCTRCTICKQYTLEYAHTHTHTYIHGVHVQVMHSTADINAGDINTGALLNGNCSKCEDTSFDQDRAHLDLATHIYIYTRT